MTASRHTSALLALSLLFAASAATAGNVQPRMHGPGGDGGECTTADAGGAPDAATPASKPAATTTAKPATVAPARIKPVVTVRGGGGDDATSTHAPRWHSFLPGMFR